MPIGIARARTKIRFKVLVIQLQTALSWSASARHQLVITRDHQMLVLRRGTGLSMSSN